MHRSICASHSFDTIDFFKQQVYVLVTEAGIILSPTSFQQLMGCDHFPKLAFEAGQAPNPPT
jgi:hypothetical protein